MSARRRTIIGIVAAVLAVIFVLAYVAQVRAEEGQRREEALARYGGEQVEICIASSDILPGEQIDSTNTTMGTWLASLLPAGSYTSFDDIKGKTVSSMVLENEPICEARLDNSSGSVSVPEGLCAVSVPAADVRAVGGAIEAGSVVDVYVEAKSGMALLGEDILVLATSSTASENTKSTGLSWITLAVTPESVQQLLSASSEDDLYFALPSGNVTDEGSAHE